MIILKKSKCLSGAPPKGEGVILSVAFFCRKAFFLRGRLLEYSRNATFSKEQK
jgi:hypothetical protein